MIWALLFLINNFGWMMWQLCSLPFYVHTLPAHSLLSLIFLLFLIIFFGNWVVRLLPISLVATALFLSFWLLKNDWTHAVVSQTQFPESQLSALQSRRVWGVNPLTTKTTSSTSLGRFCSPAEWISGDDNPRRSELEEEISHIFQYPSDFIIN